MSQIIFYMMFSNSNISLLHKFKPIETCFLMALEDKFKEFLSDEKYSIFYYSDYLHNQYLNSVFVVYDDENNTYNYLYDDCIIDFNYFFDIVNGLKYAYNRTPLFLNSFLDNLNA